MVWFSTYGKQDIIVKINNKAYSHLVLIADIEQPILRFDFIWTYKISLVWNRVGDLELVDMRSEVRAPLVVHKVPGGTPLKLAPIKQES